ncbi:MAG TPA: hypothetical protein VLT84_13900, partial [Acidobacteriota bacterium]|nr:hypothetical protein [Acidobacteriota bacterium]
GRAGGAAGAAGAAAYRAAARGSERGAAGDDAAASALRVTRTGGGYEISFAAPAGVSARTGVFDASGRCVARLGGAGTGPTTSGASRATGATLRTVRWNGHDTSGAPLARGVYFVRVEAGGSVKAAKLVHLGN